MADVSPAKKPVVAGVSPAELKSLPAAAYAAEAAAKAGRLPLQKIVARQKKTKKKLVIHSRIQ
jgi:hypothetical protein